jgi:hypothetical protein
MMEIIHSTNITFNGNSNENVGAKKGTVPRKTRSPVESKSPDASPIKSNISSPVKELHGDFPSRASRPPAVANIDSPRHEESPLFKRVHDIPKYQANETPTSWKKRESPADSGIELSPISISPPKINPKVTFKIYIFYLRLYTFTGASSEFNF